ncbi:MAG: hypothetical protein OEW60_02270 [Thiovulaceae bacterium]|nr:hypothetical protein [Sulfurimonadaceae bacterium]
MNKVLLILIISLVTGTAYGELIDAKSAKALSSSQSTLLDEHMSNNPKVNRLINDMLNIVNKEILANAKKGYHNKVLISITRDKNNAILQRLKNIGSPLNERIKREVINRIQKKGYKVDIQNLNDSITFYISW